MSLCLFKFHWKKRSIMNLFQTNLVHFRLQQVLNIVSDISYNTYFSLITVTCRV
jgi:hypothetical protein